MRYARHSPVSATSRSRCELLLLSAPSTRTTSVSSASSFTASCRFWVAKQMSEACRHADVGETRLERVDDVPGFIHAEGCLGDKGDAVRIGNLDRGGIIQILNQQDLIRSFAHGADDFVVAVVTNQQNLVAITNVSDGFDMNLCDERARGINHIELTTLRHATHDGSDTVRAKDDARACGNVRDFLNEYRALSFKVAHDKEVVDDLTTHIDRRAVFGPKPTQPPQWP